MKIDVYFSPAQVDEMQLRDKNVVVIDVTAREHDHRHSA